MFITVAVILCQSFTPIPPVNIPPPGECFANEISSEEIVTTSDLEPSLDSIQSCLMHSQIGIADWKSKHPIFSKPAWRITRIKCVPGHYEPKGRA